MLEFGDTVYYIDLKAFDAAITIHHGKNEIVTDSEVKITEDGKGNVINIEKFERKTIQSKEIDAAKYDMLKTFIEYIIDTTEEIDDSLGAERALETTSLPYKIVFNTLFREGIIKEK